jgi:hypothetical protein
MNNNETGQAAKRLDMSVLPDGFLIGHQTDPNLLDPIDTFNHYNLGFMDKYFRVSNSRSIYRPALNHWHFNDGSMVLPDGLVAQCHQRGFINMLSGVIDNGQVWHPLREEWYAINHIDASSDGHQIIAVKILGVTPEYAEHGKKLGMEVIEL